MFGHISILPLEIQSTKYVWSYRTYIAYNPVHPNYTHLCGIEHIILKGLRMEEQQKQDFQNGCHGGHLVYLTALIFL